MGVEAAGTQLVMTVVVEVEAAGERELHQLQAAVAAVVAPLRRRCSAAPFS